MLRSPRSFALVTVIAVLALTYVPPAAAGSVALADGVVVDAARGVAYLMSPDGKMKAVGMSSGAVLWTSPSPAKPLAVAGDLVVAQAEAPAPGRLDLVSFRAGSGAAGGAAATVELPAGVRAGLRDEMASSFRVQARPGDVGLLVSWMATQSGDGGARGYLPAASEGAGPAAQRQVGAVELDLGSGAVSPAAPAPAAPAMASVPNSEIPGASGTLFLSADGRHVLASERQETDDPFASYRWTVYSRDTGQALGQMSSISSAAPFVVVDGSFVYLAPRTIRPQGNDVVDQPLRLAGVDLQSGRELWSREAADTRFRGPFPP